jgi:DNA-binding response OmpR family regulator
MYKILLVDDDELQRITLAEILRMEGYEIQTVNSGEDAVSALQTQLFDVMVLDLKMPGIGGIEVLRNIVDKLPDLSVIILTAYGTMDTAIEAIRYRVQDYLLKPASPETLISSIECALQKKQKSTLPEANQTYQSRLERLPGGAVLAWDRRIISWKNGSLSLTPTELRLLYILFERKNEMVTHSELVLKIQGYSIDGEEAAKILRPVVSRLRQKLSGLPEWNDRIKNVRGSGYVLEFL